LVENATQSLPAVLTTYPVAQVKQVAPLLAGQVAQFLMVLAQVRQDDALSR